MISRAIAFQANGKTILLDLMLRSACQGHLFLQIFFCGPIYHHEKFVLANRLSLRERQFWNRHTQHWDAGSWQVACLDLASCFCLVRASKPTIEQLMWPLPMTRLVSLSARRSRAHTMGSILESSGSCGQLHHKQHFGVLKKIFLPSMIGVQQCAGLFLVVLRRLACGRTKLANLLPEGSQKHLLSLLAFLRALKEAFRHSCRALQKLCYVFIMP